MQKQGIKVSFGEHNLRTDAQPEAAFNVLEQIMKHIKKIAPQLTKNAGEKNISGTKPVQAGPGTNGGCIPVGN